MVTNALFIYFYSFPSKTTKGGLNTRIKVSQSTISNVKVGRKQ